VSYDVTARRRAESEARSWRRSSRASADAIIRTDPDGLVRTANAAVGGHLRVRPAGLVGRDIALLIPADQRP
jgi:PAS domain-containing protein